MQTGTKARRVLVSAASQLLRILSHLGKAWGLVPQPSCSSTQRAAAGALVLCLRPTPAARGVRPLSDQATCAERASCVPASARTPAARLGRKAQTAGTPLTRGRRLTECNHSLARSVPPGFGHLARERSRAPSRTASRLAGAARPWPPPGRKATRGGGRGRRAARAGCGGSGGPGDAWCPPRDHPRPPPPLRTCATAAP